MRARRESGDERAQRRKVTARGRCQGQVTIVMLARAMTPAMTQGRSRAGCADINSASETLTGVIPVTRTFAGNYNHSFAVSCLLFFH